MLSKREKAIVAINNKLAEIARSGNVDSVEVQKLIVVLENIT